MTVVKLPCTIYLKLSLFLSVNICFFENPIYLYMKYTTRWHEPKLACKLGCLQCPLSVNRVNQDLLKNFIQGLFYEVDDTTINSCVRVCCSLCLWTKLSAN